MSSDPYAPPQSSLDVNGTVVESSIWSAKGRLGVLSYFANSIIIMLVVSSLGLIGAGILYLFFGDEFPAVANGETPSSVMMIAGGAVMIPFFILTCYLAVCLNIRRLHDRDHTGWLSLLSFIPILGSLFMIYVCLFPGQKQANRFGAPRPTRTWEKVLGIMVLAFTVAALIAAILSTVSI